jgi:hypothetical protein
MFDESTSGVHIQRGSLHTAPDSISHGVERYPRWPYLAECPAVTGMGLRTTFIGPSDSSRSIALRRPHSRNLSPSCGAHTPIRCVNVGLSVLQDGGRRHNGKLDRSGHPMGHRSGAGSRCRGPGCSRVQRSCAGARSRGDQATGRLERSGRRARKAEGGTGGRTARCARRPLHASVLSHNSCWRAGMSGRQDRPPRDQWLAAAVRYRWQHNQVPHDTLRQ